MTTPQRPPRELALALAALATISLTAAAHRAAPPVAGLSPLQFGCRGDGVRDDTRCMQAAIDAASAAGAPLVFDASHLYLISATLRIDAPVVLEGPFRYGVWTITASGKGPGQDCPWGLISHGMDRDMIRATAVTGEIRGLCIDMSGNEGRSPPHAGAAIALQPPDASAFQSGWSIEANTILYPYEGIAVDGAAGGGHDCCGKGATADGVVIARNTIVSPVEAGISNGRRTVNAATSGISYSDNNILCNSPESRSRATGFALYDGDIDYDGTNNGPELCRIGFAIVPGQVGGAGQIAGGNLRGVVGDNSGLYQLLIQPSSPQGTVQFVDCIDCWASSYAAPATGVLIDGKSFGGSIQELTFTALTTKLAPNQLQPGLDIEGGSGGPYDVIVADSLICPANSAARGSVALKVALAPRAADARLSFRGDHIGGGCPGLGVATSTGLSLALNGAVGDVLVADNDFSAVQAAGGVPIAYAPSNDDALIIRDNLGIDNQTATVADAETIQIPVTPTVAIRGTAVVVRTLTGGWQNREVRLITVDGAVSFGRGGDICNALTSAGPDATVLALWNQGQRCWLLH